MFRLLVLAALLVLTGCQTAAVSEVPAPVPVAEVSAATGAAAVPDGADAPLAPGNGRFLLTEWGGPDIPVWTYVPVGRDLDHAPIVIVMHGTRRDADRYLREWRALAQLNNFIVAAPEFSRDDWPGSAGYNLGNVFEEEGVGRQPQSVWAFSAIESVFDAVVGQLGGSQTGYTLYGHSAGSQFVHRYLFYTPDTRAKRLIAANAGWYTMPDFDVAYPYGLKGSGVTREAIAAALQKDVIVLLGDLDNDRNHSSLRRAPEAMAQGPHRFARGQSFLARARAEADALGVPFGWRLAIVNYAKHSNGEMALGAAQFIE